MPRDPGTGVYTLPLPPTEPRRIPVTGWANTTVEDLAAAMNNIPGTALADGSVTTPKLADGAVTNPKTDLYSGLGIRGTGVPGTESSWMGFYNEDKSARWGYVGKGGLSNPDIYLAADSGRVRLLSSPTDPVVGLERGQLQFPATQNPSSNANTLDDYEEGTFTPSFTFATPGNLSVVYDARVGEYVKVGRMVTVAIQIRATTFTHTTASGIFQLTGLPFLTAGPVCCGSSSYMRGFVTGADTQIAFHTSGAFITGVFSNNATGSISGMTQAHLPSGSLPYLIVTLTYFTST